MSVLTDVPCRREIHPPGRAISAWTAIGSLFERTTSSGRLIPAIDGLRSLAILAVIVHHLGGYVAQRTPGLDFQDARQTIAYRIMNVGNSGVQLFFVISGFILALPFAEQYLRSGKPVRIHNYFSRRLRRLHIPYIVNLASLSCLILAVKKQSWSDVIPHLTASSFYLHNIVYQSMSTINGVAWSLEIEVQFYILAPLLACVYRIPNALVRRGIFCTAVASAIIIKSTAHTEATYPLAGTVLYYIDYFLCGMLLADGHVSSSSVRGGATKASLWDVLGLIGLSSSLLVLLSDTAIHLLPLTLTIFCAAVLWGRRLNMFFSIPLLVLIGGMCYTTYLYHFGVISLAGRVVTPWTSGFTYPAALGLQALVMIPLILSFSAILFVFVEKPCMNWGPLKARTT